MIVKCPECQTMYQLADEKITAPQVKVKCKKCQTIFEIRKPSPKSIPLPKAKPEDEEEDQDYQATLHAFVPPVEQSDEHSTEIKLSIGQKKLRIPSNKKFSLEIQEGMALAKNFEIKKPSLVIGRSGADLILGDPEVSRRHCVLEIYEDTIILRDLDSTNGTFLNELRIKTEKLKHDDRIQAGNTFLIFHEES